jgi:hypothetical protein
MAQYVVHKIGFWYTDEGYKMEQEKGTVMAMTKSLNEAKAIKSMEDIKSLKGATRISPFEFIPNDDNFDEVYEKLEVYYNTTLRAPANDKSHIELTKHLSDEQITQILSIIGVSFHTIVEYGDDEVINPADYKFDEGGSDYIGF